MALRWRGLFILSLLVRTGVTEAAPPINVLHCFDDQLHHGMQADGVFPWAGLVQGKDGALYGTATTGGANGSGTVFRITTSGAFTVLHAFGESSETSANTDGTHPFGGLIQGKDGYLCGTTHSGGRYQSGTVFKISASGHLTILHSFASIEPVNSEGAYPGTGLVLGHDGAFYGEARYGGAGGSGTVFRITRSGDFTVIYQFSARNNRGRNTDGGFPVSGLTVGSDGNLYGTTSDMGANRCGTVFRITTSGQFNTLYSFRSNDLPNGQLIYLDGMLYGTARQSGLQGKGMVFKITPNGSIERLHIFGEMNPQRTIVDGTAPVSGLTIGGDGAFYGTMSRPSKNSPFRRLKIPHPKYLSARYAHDSDPPFLS